MILLLNCMSNIEQIKIVRSERRSIAIVVLPTGTVEVKAPRFLPDFAIRSFIKSRSRWIEERLVFLKKNSAPKREFAEGEKYMFLGKEYQVEFGNYIYIEIKEDKLLFPLGMKSTGKLALEKWYIKQAKITIKNLVDEYVKIIGTSYNGISFSDTRSKWGSCTSDNRLQFNWRLIMAPLLVIRYVVIHELIHTINKSHSAIFWNKVRKVNPSYKQQIRWLKLNGDKLNI